MPKNKKAVKNKKTEESIFNRFNINNIVPEKYQTIALFGIILLIFLIYFSPMYFGGKTFQSPDIVTSHSLENVVHAPRDGYTLWYPYIFGGMPAYALAVDYKWFNLIYVGIRAVRDTFSAPFSAEYVMWSFYLILLTFNSFLLISFLTKNRLLGFFGGLATSFSTGIVLFLFIGHVTKLASLAFIPLLFLLLLKFQKKISLRNFAILIIVAHLLIQSWHVQIIFYALFASAIYFVFYFISAISKKNAFARNQILKSAGTFAAALLIALLIQADNFTQIYNWNPYSTRGTESILDKTTGKNPQKSESDFYQYATNWSFSPEEISTFVIPSYYGFGKIKYKGQETRGQEIGLNTYFGQMPFVDVAMYMGILIFFLGLFAMFTMWENSFVKYLTILILISLLISFGRTFPPVYNLMFYYFPFFDKFRVPSMILILVQISFPILAAFGLKRIIDLKNDSNEKLKKFLLYSAYTFTALLIISVVLPGIFESSFTSRFVSSQKGGQMVSYYNKYGFDISQVVTSLFHSDLVTVLALLSVASWLIIGYLKSMLSRDLLIILLAGFTLFDLFKVDNRAATYNNQTDMKSLFTTPDYISFIKARKDKEPFRILNIKQDGSLGSFNSNSNFNAHFLMNDFYGYSAIKPRAYQDYIDIVGPVNPTLWNLANVKYIIADKAVPMPNLTLLKQTKSTFIYENQTVLPRLFLVNKVEQKNTIDILNAVKANSFNPKNIAYLEGDKVKSDSPDSTASITNINYRETKITADVHASGNNFLVMSDTYYPNGWKAYVDGNETEIYRTDHAFRGIIVPKGEHKIAFIFAPVSFTVSKYLSLTLSSGAIILLIFGIWRERKNNEK